MKALFRFEKLGAASLISHLDLQRAMHRALNRAGLPVEFSRGFHPQAEVSFAQALALGVESVGEYMLVSFAQDVTDEAAQALNAVLPPGIRITAFTPADDKAAAPMAIVSASRWVIGGGVQPGRAGELLDAPRVIVRRKAKGGDKPFDIRPGILQLSATGEKTEALLKAGSVMNVRPGELLEALGLPAATALRRAELYAQNEEGRLRTLLEYYKESLF